MALTFIKRSSVPVSVKGKTATVPTVSISDKGQLSLNTVATKFLGGVYLVAIAFDAGKLYMFNKAAKAVKNLPDSEFFAMRKAKKGETVSMAATNLLRSKDVFGDNAYDFANSGNQTFQATLDEKNSAIVIELPKGALAKRPVVARKKKAKVTSIKAEAGSTEALPPVTQDTSDELILESA